MGRVRLALAVQRCCGGACGELQRASKDPDREDAPGQRGYHGRANEVVVVTEQVGTCSSTSTHRNAPITRNQAQELVQGLMDNCMDWIPYRRKVANEPFDGSMPAMFDSMRRTYRHDGHGIEFEGAVAAQRPPSSRWLSLFSPARGGDQLVQDSGSGTAGRGLVWATSPYFESRP